MVDGVKYLYTENIYLGPLPNLKSDYPVSLFLLLIFMHFLCIMYSTNLSDIESASSSLVSFAVLNAPGSSCINSFPVGCVCF